MNSHRRLAVNAVSSLLQVGVSSVFLLVLYRYLLDSLGAADFGVWAVVLGTAHFGAIADLGISASGVKFVAQYIARDEPARASHVVQTILLSSAVLLGTVILLLYFALPPVLALIIRPETEIPDALHILPYALLSLWFSTLASAMRGCIDGLHRVLIRNILLVGSSVLYLLLVFLLVPQRGLTGLAEAQLLQAMVLAVASWITLRHLLPILPLAPRTWSRTIFREMIGYSMSFQGIAITKLLFEPVTKGLLSRLGGVGVVAYYEIAYKLAFYLRHLIAATHEASLPYLVSLNEREPAALIRVYLTSIHLLLLLIVTGLPLLLALAPLISQVWLGAEIPIFNVFVILLLAGWFLNLLANPAYFAYLGSGKMRWNVVGHLLISVLNLGLGLGLGLLFGPIGVVGGFSLANVVGSLFIATAYQRENHIRLRQVLRLDTLWLALAAGSGAGLTTILYGWLHPHWPLLALLPLLVVGYGACIAIPLHRHMAWQTALHWLPMLRSPAPSASNES